MSSEITNSKKPLKSEEEAKAKYRSWCEKFFGYVRPGRTKDGDIKYLNSLILKMPDSERTAVVKGILYENIKICLKWLEVYKEKYRSLDINKLEETLIDIKKKHPEYEAKTGKIRDRVMFALGEDHQYRKTRYKIILMKKRQNNPRGLLYEEPNAT